MPSTLSAGVAEYQPTPPAERPTGLELDDENAPDDNEAALARAGARVINAADRALYAAKAAGRNCVRTYAPDIDEQTPADSTGV